MFPFCRAFHASAGFLAPSEKGNNQKPRTPKPNKKKNEDQKQQGGGGAGQGKGPGNAGGWPSTTGNPSGGGRSNNPPREE